ncbi:MAG TPA: choice-of-anchor B family protein, partial [Saprospiraceae bacterium]|nr:choice-of-anchor B family protein [Saprospiraceae bacterium]
NTTFRSKLTYPNQTLANVWGYVAGGKEYALVGGANGLIIVDITNPDVPQQIVQIPGPVSLWKEIKTYGHYAYVVSEGGQGVQIIDLSGLPSASLNYHYYTGLGQFPNPNTQLNKIHALHIDTTKGYLYAYGGDMASGRARIFNLNPDPYNPTYAATYNSNFPGNHNYIHDGYVDNDTMYGGHIYGGFFSIVDMKDKSNPVLISTQPTPNIYTHNTWLSKDHRYIFTTDEVNNSYLAAFDISDPTDIRLLDKIQSNPGSNSMVHNTHILDNWAVTSWYQDGFTIVDVTRPDNLIQVGNHDTYAGAGGGSNGCWGVYPFFPSGTIVATNISSLGTNNGELWIVTPNYVRACYLEGTITNGATGNPLNGAKIELLTTVLQEFSGLDGQFKTGQTQGGLFTARVSKSGFQTVNVEVLLENGKVTPLDVELFPNGSLTITGQVLRSPDMAPVDGASVYLFGRELEYSAIADANGQFSISGVLPGSYDVTASAVDVGAVMHHEQKLTTDSVLTLLIFKDYRRDKDLLKGNNLLTIRENPFRDRIVVDYRLRETGGYTLTVVNTLGQVFETMKLTEK